MLLLQHGVLPPVLLASVVSTCDMWSAALWYLSAAPSFLSVQESGAKLPVASTPPNEAFSNRPAIIRAFCAEVTPVLLNVVSVRKGTTFEFQAAPVGASQAAALVEPLHGTPTSLLEL